MKSDIAWIIRSMTRNRHAGPVSYSFTLYAVHLRDWDNLHASSKIILDALQATGVIKSDAPAVVQKYEAHQVRVRQKNDVRAVVVLCDIE